MKRGKQGTPPVRGRCIRMTWSGDHAITGTAHAQLAQRHKRGPKRSAISELLGRAALSIQRPAGRVALASPQPDKLTTQTISGHDIAVKQFRPGGANSRKSWAHRAQVTGVL